MHWAGGIGYWDIVRGVAVFDILSYGLFRRHRSKFGNDLVEREEYSVFAVGYDKG